MTKPFIFLLLVAAVPSLSFAASFDCSKAASLPEMLICNDQELSKLDDELGAIYLRAKAKAPDQTAFKQQTRAAWKWRETNCHSKECLLTWYAQRKAVLLEIDSVGTTKCLKTGLVKLKGFVVSEVLTLEPDGRQSMVYLLNTQKPVCIHVEPIDIGEAKDVMANRFQLVSYSAPAINDKIKQYLFKQVTVEGMLSTDNVTQYYAVSDAIDVKSISAP